MCTIIAGAGTLVVAGKGALPLTGAGALEGEVSGTVSIAIAVILTMLFGWYLNRRALNTEEPLLSLLRRTALSWQSWKGTQFTGAQLTNADFSEADLSHVNFKGAQFRHPNFQGASNLHLARTYDTPLQHSAIRKLLTKQKVDENDFFVSTFARIVFQGHRP